MIDPALVAAIMVIVLVVIVLAVVSSAIVFIKPYEQGLYFRLGRFVGVLPPGMSFTAPIVSEVKRVDTSLQSFTLSFDDILSSDNMRFALTMKVHYKVTDAKKAVLETPSYTEVVKKAAETSIRLAARKMDKDEIWADSNRVREDLRTDVEKTASKYGIAVSTVEISP
jgi:regulator of protease activity HflC (stomatin/prohibitin superfamily)